MTFDSLGLIEPLLRAVAAEGYHTPTPIQHKSIPHVLAGSDLLGCAQTGTGKTAAFALPILQLLAAHKPAAPHAHPSSGQHSRSVASTITPGDAPRDASTHHHAPRKIRALILSPTRELALQIAESFQTYGRNLRVKLAVIFGGVGYRPQTDALRAGVDVVIATPGRLMDLMEQGHVDLSRVEIFVLDEADRMLDMGFIHDIRRIVARLPNKRQNLMFSATMPRPIRALAEGILRSPVSVEVAPVSSTAELVEQSLYHVEKRNKPALLAHVLRTGPAGARTLVFTRTKHGADKVVTQLHRAGIRSAAIHGNKRQNVRQRALEAFRSGDTPVLVATDIAARGIDIDEIALVVNYDLPNVPETYVHRIGRTGRAGATGLAIAFCDHEERPLLRDIEKLIRKQIPVLTDQPAFEHREPPRDQPRDPHHEQPRDQDRRPRPHPHPKPPHAHGSRKPHKPHAKPGKHPHAANQPRAQHESTPKPHHPRGAPPAHPGQHAQPRRTSGGWFKRRGGGGR